MLKLIPYTKQLISIGNQNHYEGQLVWSDGKVAYGWDYTPQQPKQPITNTPAGFWVDEEQNGRYKLAKKDLQLGKVVISSGHGNLQCYPCYAVVQDTGGYLPEHGVLHSPNGVYLYDGAVISMDASGNTLTYDDYLLKFYTNTNVQKNDTNDYPLYYCNIIVTFNGYTFIGWYYIAVYSNHYIIYDNEMLQIAEVVKDNTYTINYNYDGKEFNGSCSFTMNKKYVLLDTVITIVDVRSLHSMDTTLYDGIIAVDALRLAIDSHDERNALIEQHDYGNIIRKYFQLTTALLAYLCAYCPDRNLDGDVIYHGDYTVIYDMQISTGTGTITVSSSGVTICDPQTGTEIAHTSGNLLFVNGSYVGHGRITYDNYNNGEWDYSIWLYIDGITGTGDIEYDNGHVVVTNHLNGNYIAKETNNGLDVYYGGAVAWQGPGSISVRNLTPIEYTGNYLVSSDITGTSSQITDPTGNPTVTDGTLYAAQNGTNITVTDNGNTLYSGAGSITITNPQPVGGGVYRGSYTISIRMSGSGIIVPQNSDTYVYDNNYDIVASCVSGTVYIYDSSGTVTYSGSGTITTSNLVAIKWFGTYEIDASLSGTENVVIKDKQRYCDYTIRRSYNGFSYHIEHPTDNIVVYYKDKVATFDSNRNTVIVLEAINGQYVQVYNGQGSIYVSNIVLIDADNNIYEGDYLIWLDETGSGVAEWDINNNVYIYNLNSVLVAKEENRQIIIYDNGNVEYQGEGTITLSNTIKESDNVVILNSNVIAEENGESIDVYDNQQQLIYSGPGWIETSNLTVNRSNKKYKVDIQNGLQQIQQYPQPYWQAGTDVKLDLSNMDLLVTTQQGGTITYSNDPLGLLTTQGFIFAHGVHAWKDYVISQDGKIIWHGETDDQQQQTVISETYTGIENCFSLAWLKTRWSL